jgi:DNA-binding IclR family transcriptional regulator
MPKSTPETLSMSTEPMPEDRSPKNANRSVGVGLGVLKAIADLGRAATLSEIARAARMPASRTHRFLAGMIQVGAVRQDPASGRYDFGPLLVHLGVAALGRVDGVKLGTEALRQLTEDTGLVSVLVIWSGSGPTLIRWEQGDLGTAVRIREGRILSLLGTASGKIFLGYLPEEKTRDMVAAELKSPAHQASHSPLHTLDDVARERAKIRAEGIASNAGESDGGIAGLAAPIFDASGDVVMAIAVIGVLGIAGLEREGASADALRAAAHGISRALGGSAPPPPTYSP